MMMQRVPYMDGSGDLEIDLSRIDYTKQVFSHLDDDGVQRHFDINKLYRIAAANPTSFPKLAMPITDQQAAHIMRYNGIEQSRVRAITPKRAIEPGLVLQLDDNTHILLDGNHRYVKRYSMGRSHMRFYVFTEAEARPAMLLIPDDVGKYLLSR
jgi:hypothetical protein